MVENSNKKHQQEKQPATDESFKNFRLRRMVKENHGTPIRCLMMGYSEKILTRRSNFSAGSYGSEMEPKNLSHLLLTVGGSQINIYDNEHYGDHLDLMSHYHLPEDEPSETFTAGCWLRASGDALIGFGGSSGTIRLVSLAYSQEFRRLEGHTGELIELIGHPVSDDILISCALDHTIRVWDIQKGKCLNTIPLKVTAMCFSLDGEFLYAGTKSGSIMELSIDPNRSNHRVVFEPQNHRSPIDCLRMSSDGNLISKSTNGRIYSCDPDTGDIKLRIQARNASDNYCKFDISDDAKYLCVGSSLGSTYVHSTIDGKVLMELKHRRSTKPVQACLFARNSRNVIVASGDALLWRFDYLSDKILEEAQAASSSK